MKNKVIYQLKNKTPMLWFHFQDNLGKLVPERQTIVHFNE